MSWCAAVSQREVLADQTLVVYGPPRKALSRYPPQPRGRSPAIRTELRALGYAGAGHPHFVRTGDTRSASACQRQAPPHIVVTTPESLYILSGSESGRRMLASTPYRDRDEIHGHGGSKRGGASVAHARALEASPASRSPRVGLSATQNRRGRARFLVGTPALRADGAADCTIIDWATCARRPAAGDPRRPLER